MARLPAYRRDVEAERAADYEAFMAAHPEAGYPDWVVDASERCPEFFDPCNGYPFADEEERYFASGSNHAGEIAGLAAAGYDVGVAIPELNAAGEAALVELAGLRTKVFADSGAFGEVRYDAASDRMVLKGAPISDAEWRKRLAAYRRLAVALEVETTF